MALVLYDRVQQTGTANTTVSFTLSGSVTGYQSFSVVGNGNTTYYGATDTSGNWEVGIGTYATGGTLTRTTILASSNSGSAVTFSGTVTVFVTYPSERSVNLDGSGNVSALGTISSGTWQGSTIGVSYGGTGVTTSSSTSANSVVLRDANVNVTANNFIAGYNVITASGGTTVLTVASAYYQRISGSTTQTIQLPIATTIANGQGFTFDNDSSGTVTIVDSASGAIDTVPSGGYSYIFVEDNSTSAGSWGKYALLPASYDFSSSTANFGGATISNAVWNGTTIATGYGGTGLTTFTAANNALYSTSSSALTAGTLPVAAGGTGATTLTGYVKGSGTSALTASSTIPTSDLTGTLGIGNGGTGQTTAAAAFNALNPMTTTGDLIYEASASTAARLPIGTSGQVLTVAGGIPSWQAAGGSTTLTTTDFTATSGQTTFSVTYTPALLQGVYRNGIKLGQADYTATNGTSIVLATGAITGDLIQVQYFSSLATTTAVNSISFGSTGLTPSTATAGAVTVAGTLAVANGGTGVTTSTGSGSVVLNTSPTITTPVIDKINTSVTNTSLGAGNASIMKNRIINGAMVIDQRNAGAATANTINGYTLDRWVVQQSTTGKIIAQQNAGSVTPPAGFSNYLGVTSQSAYSVGTGDYYSIYQNIEGFNIADLNWGTANAQTVTLSFWVRSSLTGTFGGSLRGGQNYPFTYTISAANTWEQKSITIIGSTSGSWSTTNSTGVGVWISLGAGSTLSGTAGAWTGSNVTTATGATSVVGTNGATFYITGVQLEVGSSATGFEYVNYQTSLDNCQRYYQIGQVSFDWITNAYCACSNLFSPSMRATPTVTAGASPTQSNIASVTFGSTAPTGISNIGMSSTAACTTGVSRAYYYNTFTASAEL